MIGEPFSADCIFANRADCDGETRTLNRDELIAGLCRECKRAFVGGAFLKNDRVARPSLVERLLQVATGTNLNNRTFSQDLPTTLPAPEYGYPGGCHQDSHQHNRQQK